MSLDMLRDHLKRLSECQFDEEKNVNPILMNVSVNEDINVEFTPEEIKSIVKKVEKWESIWHRTCNKWVP